MLGGGVSWGGDGMERWGKGTQSVGKCFHVGLMVVLWVVLRAVE